MVVEYLGLIDNYDLPLVVIILLYDKIKTNGSLRKTVENNTLMLEKLMKRIK
jgi:hypothetical protein|tara:strand:+ start:266 stop:421 length:156 start_codon:yes stop_codon:yes gene_type:complete